MTPSSAEAAPIVYDLTALPVSQRTADTSGPATTNIYLDLNASSPQTAASFTQNSGYDVAFYGFFSAGSGGNPNTIYALAGSDLSTTFVAGTNGTTSGKGGGATVSRLNSGDVVSSSTAFVTSATGGFMGAYTSNNNGSVLSADGPWIPLPSSGYVGVQFDINGAAHYGFVGGQVSVVSNGNLNIRVDSVGYESVAGAPITIAAVPEPSALMLLLAAGSAGVVVLKRRRAS